MFRLFRLFSIFAAIAWTSSACSVAVGQTESEQSYVMLFNGSIFHGVVRPVGERLEIRLGTGSSIQIDNKQVAFVAPTKRALYDLQVASTRQWGTGEHWHLTEWCIQQGMIDEAIYHFQQLAQIAEPTNKLRQLEHKLKEAILSSSQVQTMLAEQQKHLAPSRGRIQDVAKMGSEQSDAPNRKAADPLNSDVVLASATSIPSATQASASKVVDPDLALGIPSYVKKAFQSNISPLLVRRCGQAGCHGLPGKSVFHIRQAAGEQAAEIAAENLENVLRYVDIQSPTDSDLIRYALKEHGDQKHPSFNPLKREDERIHVERITQWIKSLELSKASSGPEVQFASAVESLSVRALPSTNSSANVLDGASVAPVGSELSRMEKIAQWRDVNEVQDREAKLSRPAKTAEGPIGLTSGEINDLEKAIERLERKHTQKSQKDPFDPNVFNTKYSTKKP
jgi:hypothetical protein